jgi:Zn-dependent protease
MNMLGALILILIFLFAVTIHEASHGFVANMLGDPTPKLAGRLTLNPIAHLDPIGTLLPLLLIFSGSPMVFGWAKPVPINPYNFKDPSRGEMLVSFAGPFSNFLAAWVVAILIRYIPIHIMMTGITASVLSSFILVNISLAVFNLIPIPPLDGSHILEPFIPNSYKRMFEQYGFFILIFILIFPPTADFLFYIINFLFRLMT